jgi:hypothetical protein
MNIIEINKQFISCFGYIPTLDELREWVNEGEVVAKEPKEPHWCC